MCEILTLYPLAKAVNTAKLSNRILVVLIEGKDELSLNVSSAFSLPATETDGCCFIGLRISEGSESYAQFARIYSSRDSKNFAGLKAPIALFIGVHGLPLAVIGVNNVLDLETFPHKLESVLKTFSGMWANEATDMVYKQFDKNVSSGNPLYEAYKIVNEAITNKEKRKLKSNQEKVAEEKKIKLEENVYGGQQHADDTASDITEMPKIEERNCKSLDEQIEIVPTVSESKSKEDICNGNVVQRNAHTTQETKILFRLKNGKMIPKTFCVTTQLKEVRQFVKEELGIKLFDLTFLARFKKEDEDLTLEQLNMVPSAVLQVTPSSSGELSVLKKGFSRLATLFWYLAMPVITYVQYITSFVFGGVRRTQDRRLGSSSSSSSKPPPPPPPGDSGPQQPQSQNRSSSNKYSSSNIHTLRSINDDNNSQNTYNGNSTQQMP